MITGNHTSYSYGYGGGLYSGGESNPALNNVIFSGNSSGYGGAIYFYGNSPALDEVVITGNTANYSGGGLYMEYSTPSLSNVTINGNTAETGGGIYGYDSQIAFNTTDRCNIYLNDAGSGWDLYNASYDTVMHMVLDTFTVVQPKVYHAQPLSSFTFDILHGMIPQVEADLWVSPTGDDSNTGLSPAEPLKTIRLALIKTISDSLSIHTVNLMEGTYSPQSTGEEFPVMLSDFVNLDGAAPETVSLDAGFTDCVMRIEGVDGITVSDITLRGGNTSGIYCTNASPVLENLIITENTAYYGGGINCDN
jgi:hypothetical protein